MRRSGCVRAKVEEMKIVFTLEDGLNGPMKATCQHDITEEEADQIVESGKLPKPMNVADIFTYILNHAFGVRVEGAV